MRNKQFKRQRMYERKQYNIALDRWAKSKPPFYKIFAYIRWKKQKPKTPDFVKKHP